MISHHEDQLLLYFDVGWQVKEQPPTSHKIFTDMIRPWNEHWSFWIDKNVNYLVLQVKQSDGSAGQLSGNTGHYLVQMNAKKEY